MIVFPISRCGARVELHLEVHLERIVSGKSLRNDRHLELHQESFRE